MLYVVHGECDGIHVKHPNHDLDRGWNMDNMFSQLLSILFVLGYVEICDI